MAGTNQITQESVRLSGAGFTTLEGPRITRPWVAGGAIFSISENGALGERCTTGAIGTWENNWAILTAAHCVRQAVGTQMAYFPDGLEEVSPGQVSGQPEPLGESVWVLPRHDLAVIKLTEEVSARISSSDLAIYVDGSGAKSVPASHGFSLAPEGSGVFMSGSRSGWQSGVVVGVDNGLTLDGTVNLRWSKYLVRDNGAPPLTRGDSGAGAFKYLSSTGSYYLVGIFSGEKYADSAANFTDPRWASSNGFEAFSAPDLP